MNKVTVPFLVSMFLIKIYPFYIFPLPGILGSSLTVAKLLIVFVFCEILYLNYRTINKVLSRNSVLFWLLGFFLLSQTLSIVPANNLLAFLKIYHNTILFIATFFISYFISLHKSALNALRIFILLTATTLLAIDLIMQLYFVNILPFLKTYVQKEVVDVLLYNAALKKFSLAQSAEILTPFFIYTFVQKKDNKFLKAISIISILLLFPLTAISNFRSRIMVLLFCLAACLAIGIFSKKTLSLLNRKLKLVAFIAFTCLVGLISIYAIRASTSLYSYNVLDRFLLQDEYLDKGSIDSRIEQYEKSIDLFYSSPLLGVGLGNYGDYVDLNKSLFLLEKDYQKAFRISVMTHPHGILFQLLAETGILGLISFILLVGYFLFNDIRKIRKGLHNQIWPYFVSSWALIIYALVNPADSLFIFGWFWFLRGITEGTQLGKNRAV